MALLLLLFQAAELQGTPAAALLLLLDPNGVSQDATVGLLLVLTPTPLVDLLQSLDTVLFIVVLTVDAPPAAAPEPPKPTAGTGPPAPALTPPTGPGAGSAAAGKLLRVFSATVSTKPRMLVM